MSAASLVFRSAAIAALAVGAGAAIAGGQAPEIYTKNASIRMLPRDEVHELTRLRAFVGVAAEVVLTSKDGIRSFTLGAAELRLDDVCFER